MLNFMIESNALLIFNLLKNGNNVAYKVYHFEQNLHKIIVIYYLNSIMDIV
jgi:hypothetical protein